MRSYQLLSVLCFGLVTILSAQPPPAGTITGRVYDADLNVPIEYANIVVRSQRDSTQVTGGITDKDGRFELTGIRPGRFFVEVSFIGYRQYTVNDVQLGPGGRIDLGRITLRQTAVAVAGVEATADRPRLTYQIDKKVVDVANQPTPPTGTAVDVLENVPSVKVDDDGKVTLRGSGNFRVLIDGRPSPLEGSEALEQIPASTIDNIEIITNPSAKFDPEGPAGIINVVLKKQRQSGTSGIVNLRGSTEGSYGGDFQLGWRDGNLNLFAGADFNRRAFPGQRRAEAWTRDTSGDTTYVYSTGSMQRGGYPFGIRAGGDIGLGQNDRISITGNLGRRSGGGVSTSIDTQIVRPAADTSIFATGDTNRRGGWFWSLNADESHNFGRQGHDLITRLEFRRRDIGEYSTQYQESTGVITSGQKTTEDGPSNRLNITVDYTLPLREADRLEAGWSSGLQRSRDSTTNYRYNPATDSYELAPAYSHQVMSADDVHAIYATYAASFKPFGIKLGLRGERSLRNIRVVDQDSTVRVTAIDLFPSLHASYSFGEQHEVMASYTRRINRPGPWQLQPLAVWWNPRLIRQGNPALLPEYIDAFELGWQVPLPIGRLTIEGYYRRTSNVIDELTSVYAPQVFLRQPANVGSSQATGAELVAYVMLNRWLGLNLTGDISNYRLAGTANGRSFDTTSLNWQTNLGFEIRPLPDMRIQLFGRYSGPSATAQGTQDGFLMTGASIRQQLLQRRLSLTLQAQDLLGTSGHGGTAGGDGYDFYTRFRFQRAQAPSFSLGLTWNFNNYRPERRRTTTEEIDEPDDLMR